MVQAARTATTTATPMAHQHAEPRRDDDPANRTERAQATTGLAVASLAVALLAGRKSVPVQWHIKGR